jgi:hypothetical protein
MAWLVAAALPVARLETQIRTLRTGVILTYLGQHKRAIQ